MLAVALPILLLSGMFFSSTLHSNLLFVFCFVFQASLLIVFPFLLLDVLRVLQWNALGAKLLKRQRCKTTKLYMKISF